MDMQRHYTQSEVDMIRKEYETKMAGLTYDVNDMRQLYQKAQDEREKVIPDLVKYEKTIEELTKFNLQLMKLYYNKATGRNIKED